MKRALTLQDVRIFTEKVAAKKGWILNPDDEFLTTILEGLLGNYQNLGYYQCPCRISWDDRKKDRDIMCPCDYSPADIEEYGHCFCALFLTQAFVNSGKEPNSIPERRPAELFPE